MKRIKNKAFEKHAFLEWNKIHKGYFGYYEVTMYEMVEWLLARGFSISYEDGYREYIIGHNNYDAIVDADFYEALRKAVELC